MSFFMVDYSSLMNDSVFDELSERKARLTKEKCDSVREANESNLRARSYGLRGVLGIPGLVAELWAPIYVFANIIGKGEISTLELMGSGAVYLFGKGLSTYATGQVGAMRAEQKNKDRYLERVLEKTEEIENIWEEIKSADKDLENIQ